MTETNQTGGETTVTASAESGTAGNAEAITELIAIAAGNVAENTSEANIAIGNGNNSTDSVGNHDNSGNTNTAGDNSGIFALAAAAAGDDTLWDILTGNGNDNGHNTFLADNNTLIGVINGNGNSTQQSWFAGNNMNNQRNVLSPVVGGVAINAAVTAAVVTAATAIRAVEDPCVNGTGRTCRTDVDRRPNPGTSRGRTGGPPRTASVVRGRRADRGGRVTTTPSGICV